MKRIVILVGILIVNPYIFTPHANSAPAETPSTSGATSGSMMPGVTISKQWEVPDLQSQYEAGEVYQGNGFVYVGGGKKIGKIELATGKTLWVYPNDQGYQPSYPVANGNIVVFGSYYQPFVIGLDDKTGTLLWKIPVGGQIMSGACFSDDLVYIGSYDKYLYAIDWKKGDIKWKTSLNNFIWSTPTIYKDQVIAGSYDGNIYFIDKRSGAIISKLDCGGPVASNPIITNELLFASVNYRDPKVKNPKSSSNTRNKMLVISLKTNKVVAEYISDNSFSKKVIVSGNDVFFFDRYTVYAFNPKNTRTTWKAKVNTDLHAFPFLTPNKVIFPINTVGRHGEHSGRVLVLDRASGKEISTQNTGGVAIYGENYFQYDDILVNTNGSSTAYKINPEGLIKKPPVRFEWEKKSPLDI